MSNHSAAILFILREHFGRRRKLGCGCSVGKSFANVKVTVATEKNGKKHFRFRCRKCSNAVAALSMRRLRDRLAVAP
jgi:hypothetical protein